MNKENETLQDELDEMEKAVEMPQGPGDDLRTDPPGTESPGTQAPGTEEPGTESPGTEAPATEPPEEDSRDKELRELREKVDELTAKRTTKAPPTEAPPTQAPATDVPISEEDFLDGVDLDELTRDPDLFNKTLNNIYTKAIEFVRGEVKKGNELVIRSVPDIVKNTAALNKKLEEVNKQFYEDNPDLVKWNKTVAAVFEEQIDENPGKRYDELLPGVADIVRERIGLQKDAKKKDDKKPPPLPHKKGTKRETPKPETDSLLKEMDEMDEALERI